MPAFETLEGSNGALTLMDEGILRAVECTAVCRPLQAGPEEAEQKLRRRLEAGDPCVVVNVRQALRGGAVPLPDALPPYLCCPFCGFDRFTGGTGGAVNCPCCGRSFVPSVPKAEEETGEPPIPFSTGLRFSVIQGGAAVTRVLSRQEEGVRYGPASFLLGFSQSSGLSLWFYQGSSASDHSFYIVEGYAARLSNASLLSL